MSERELHNGDAQDFAHKQSLRTDSPREPVVRAHLAGCRCELCKNLPPFQEHDDG